MYSISRPEKIRKFLTGVTIRFSKCYLETECTGQVLTLCKLLQLDLPVRSYTRILGTLEVLAPGSAKAQGVMMESGNA